MEPGFPPRRPSPTGRPEKRQSGTLFRPDTVPTTGIIRSGSNGNLLRASLVEDTEEEGDSWGGRTGKYFVVTAVDRPVVTTLGDSQE